MKRFGVREICDVVLKAKTAQKVGNKIFYKGEPVCYFDTLKTSSMEGAATSVYAQGGRGNARLIAWEGERTITFTMEDALISQEGIMILTGAGLMEASESRTIKQHMTETVDYSMIERTGDTIESIQYKIMLSHKPYLPTDKGENFAYVMFMKDGQIISEPFIPVHSDEVVAEVVDGVEYYPIVVSANHDIYDTMEVVEADREEQYKLTSMIGQFDYDSVLVDYYTERTSNAMQIDITADKFGGNYYLEASTLFRDTDGVDMPAEFIIPNCKVQSNFTFTMASSGDPSTFTFTMDAFPDFTRFDHSKKVLAAIQVINADETRSIYRTSTAHDPLHEKRIAL